MRLKKTIFRVKEGGDIVRGRTRFAANEPILSVISPAQIPVEQAVQIAMSGRIRIEQHGEEFEADSILDEIAPSDDQSTALRI
ncbi:MAG: hypothetical protein KC983_10865, partial [Phycisphaerales bacterium]|nr:hypothetical protein [Phycisphaerales bacterium]